MKRNKLFKSIVAILVAVMMMGTLIPTFAMASDEVIEEATTSEQDRVDNTDINTVGNAFDAFIQTIRDFFQRIFDFFKDLFGLNDEPEEPTATPVDSVEALEEAIAAGGEICLTADIEIDGEFNIDNAVAIDLNGKELSINKMNANADIAISNGTFKQAEIEVENKYGFDYHAGSPIDVKSGTLTFENVTLETTVPATLMIRNNCTVETLMFSVLGGTCVVNNCEIIVKSDSVYGNLIQYEGVFGISIEAGEITVNNSSFTLEGLGGRDGSDYILVVAAGDAEKTVNLNNVTVNGALYYAACKGSNLVINTTDAESAWAGKYMNCEVNFVG